MVKVLLLIKTYEEDGHIRGSAVDRGMPLVAKCRPHWMIRGSVKLFQACQPTLMEGLCLILERITNIEITSLILTGVVDVLVDRTVATYRRSLLLQLLSGLQLSNSSCG